ncbi:MAG TPA: ABC transporter substrate-binding protein [Ktedonobacterales bacterium]|jgi:polar amino acid transport system substrate-binding protein
MIPASLRTLPKLRRVMTVGAVGAAMGLSLLLAACGASSTPTTGGNNANCPSSSTVSSWHLVNPGKLTIASDTTYAPAEYSDPNNPTNFIGYDMDLAREFAKRLCLEPNIIKADFGAIIPDLSGPALGQQRYDMSISSFTINSDRQQKVDMIPYFTAGESILVQTGNPKSITSIDTMCGKIVAAQDNTVELAELQDANGTGDGSSGQAAVCKNNQIKIVHHPSQNDVVLEVVNGSADASYQDQPVTDYYAKQNSGKLESGGITVDPTPQGIVMRKDNSALETAITNALAAMRTDGTYRKILTNWGVQKLAYPPLS